MDDSSTATPSAATPQSSSTLPQSSSTLIGESIENLSASLSDRIEFLAQELRGHWRQGDRSCIEDLGEMFQELATNPEHLLDLIYHEVLIREEFGDSPQLDDYVARFPELVERLERLFAVHGALEDDDWNDDFEGALRDAQLPRANDRHSATPTLLDDDPSPTAPKWPRRYRDLSSIEAPPGYHLLDEIGRGGMAVVFRARQEVLDRIVALKMLVGGTMASPESLGRLKQEARAVAQLQHPGIVQIHEVGEHRGLPYLSLEYVSGGTLHNWLHGRPLPPIDAALIVEQLARTTAFAHERGIVHRDLKPANVLLAELPPDPQASATVNVGKHSDQQDPSNPNIRTKISDFGLARMNDGLSQLTATGQIIGTPSYMAPEQASGSADAASPALDIYSLGAILYELLTGRPPFRGATLFETLEQVRSNDPVSPRHLQPRTPRDLETICLKCLEKNPARRYSSALALANELRCFLNGESITARPAGIVERWGKWIRKNPAVTALTLLVVVLFFYSEAAILNEARRANHNEKAAINDSRRADQERALANQERKRAEESARLADEARQQAETAREQAEAARQQAVQSQSQAESDRTSALESQRSAEVAFDRTLKALSSLGTLGVSIRWQPGQEQIGGQILDRTLGLYEELLRDQRDNPVVKSRRIMTLINAGEIHRTLNNFKRALELLTEAAEIIDQDLKSPVSDDQLGELLQRARYVWWNIGVIHKDSGQPSPALVAFNRSLDVCDKLHQLRPSMASQSLTSRANLLTNKAVPLRDLGQHQAALESLEAAIKVAREAVALDPKANWSRSELALALHDYSMLLRHFKRDTDANSAFTESLALRKKNFESSSNSIMSRIDLVRSWTDEGVREINAKHYDSGIALLREAMAQLEPLLSASPEVYEFHDRMGTLLLIELQARFEMSDREAMAETLSRVARQLLQTRRKFPQNMNVNVRAHEWLHMHGNLLLMRGDEAAAAQYFEEAIECTRVLQALPTSPGRQHPAWYDYLLAWRLGTCPITSLRNTEEALKYIQLAKRYEPCPAQYIHAHGAILLEAGSYEEAEELFATSMKLEQDDAHRVMGAEFTTAKLEDRRRYHRLLQALNWSYMKRRDEAIESIKLIPVAYPLNSANSSDYWRYYERVQKRLGQ